jgi:hypothetical protein
MYYGTSQYVFCCSFADLDEFTYTGDVTRAQSSLHALESKVRVYILVCAKMCMWNAVQQWYTS